MLVIRAVKHLSNNFIIYGRVHAVFGYGVIQRLVTRAAASWAEKVYFGIEFG